MYVFLQQESISAKRIVGLPHMSSIRNLTYSMSQPSPSRSRTVPLSNSPSGGRPLSVAKTYVDCSNSVPNWSMNSGVVFSETPVTRDGWMSQKLNFFMHASTKRVFECSRSNQRKFWTLKVQAYIDSGTSDPNFSYIAACLPQKLAFGALARLVASLNCKIFSSF